MTLLLLAACASDPPREGAVGLTVAYDGFRPRCVRVSAADAAGAGAPARTLELEGKGEPRGGALKLALFRDSSWGLSLRVRAEAFERAACVGSAVVSTEGTVTVVEGQVTELRLALAAQDVDEDGFVEAAGGGLDCEDGAAGIHPDAVERCDAVDNNCDGATDEGFSVGQSCTTASSCQSAWSCGADGARACVETQGRWRRDADGDGYGSSTGTALDACLQPAGYVANATDCDDGRATVNPAASERCDGRDNDCDGTQDEGFDVGTACTGPVAGGKSCSGVRVCQSETVTACNAPTPTLLYRDADGDGQGDRNTAAIGFCLGESTQGYVANKTDCDDADAGTKEGIAEVCDGANKDNNCNGQDDVAELSIGQACTGFPTATHCEGAWACAGGTRTCQGSRAKVDYFVDADVDGVGTGTAVAACSAPAGRVPASGDCNDGDPWVKPGAAEICDGKDNDCDSATPSELQCKPLTGGWTRNDTATSDDWYSVSLFGNGGVAIAGEGSQVRVQTPGTTTLSATAQQCTGDWQAVWVDAASGTLYLGGETDLGVYKIGAGTCSVDNWAPGSYVRALYGLSGSDLHGVGEVRPVPTGGNALPGRSVVWNGTESTAGAVTRDHSFVLADVHGVSRDVLFAVGGDAGDARVYRFAQDGGTWAWTYQSDLGNKMLRAVWVVNSGLAFAGGEANTLYRWSNNSWQSITGPGAGDIVSLVAFGTNAVYALTFSAGATPTADISRVFRYDGTTWTQVGATFNPGKLRDLAATRPDDLWAVGRDGVVAHWP